MKNQLEIMESQIQAFNDVLNALGRFNKGEIIGICGAPGIGKTVFARFLAHVFSLNRHVLYTSFQKTRLELERILYLTNSDVVCSESEDVAFGNQVNENNTYSNPQDENIDKSLFGGFWDPEAFTSFYGCSIDLSNEQPIGSLQIGDVKYSKYHFDLLHQIETMLNMSIDNHMFEVLIIDDIDLFPAKVKEFEEWDYVQFFQALKSLQHRFNILIIIVSNIRFSRVKSEKISVGSASYVEGGASFMEICDKVIFADRPSYYKMEFENFDDEKDIFNVFLVKNESELVNKKSPSLIKYSKDFKYLKFRSSGFDLIKC
jgi:nucleoside-triphosphatase THEP1